MNLEREKVCCDSFLSDILNNNYNKIVPVVMDNANRFDRGVYDICTDNGDYTLYIRYSLMPSGVDSKNNINIWDYQFDEKEMEQIKTLVDEGKKERIKFIFVYSTETLQKDEYVVINCNEFIKYIDLYRCFYDSVSVKIKLKQNNQIFVIYRIKNKDNVYSITKVISDKIVNR